MVFPKYFRGEIRSEESQVVFDFSYFKNIDGVEAAIDKNSRLQEIDARVKEEHLEILQKFYKVFLNWTFWRKVYLYLESVLSQYKSMEQTLLVF